MARLLQYKVCVLMIILIAVGCSELRNDLLLIPGTSVTYEANVKQILNTRCVGCHSGTSPRGDYDLSTLIGILDSGKDNIPNAIPGDAANLLLVKISPAGSMSRYLGSNEDEAVLTAWVVDSNLNLGEPLEHPIGWTNPADNNFHGKYLQQNNFDLAACSECHGADYAGGISKSSCLGCHVETPEDCSTCHGRSFSSSGAPPKDVAGNVLTVNRTVGAHATHLAGGNFSRPVECGECHLVPVGIIDAGHIDDSPHAELVFGSQATNLGANPVFNQDLTCSNVYCHGNFPAGRKDNAPTWTEVDAGLSGCGTCHGLPPEGKTRSGISHPQFFDCSLCHSSVVATNLPVITDRTKHDNGKVDF